MPAIITKKEPVAKTAPIPAEQTPAPLPTPQKDNGADMRRCEERIASMEASVIALQKQVASLASIVAAQASQLAKEKNATKTITIDKWQAGRISSLTVRG